jgi:DNA-binding response OmpR family regulator
MMPGLDGVQLCQKVRADPKTEPIYVILLSSRDTKASIIEGLEAGADDYLAKPFDRDELQARIRVGVRTIELRQRLAERIRQHEEALSQINLLQGILPICSYCKKVRDDQNYWQQVESYVSTHSEARFSHSICPDCYESVVIPELAQLQRQGQR